MSKICLPIIFILLLAVGMWSCTNIKNLQYMQGEFDSTRLSAYNLPEPVFQKGDILAITVYSDSKTASELYNQSMVTTGSAVAVTAAPPGYLVDNQGDIQFQGLGKLHVEGLNKAQLMEILIGKLKEFLTNAYCTIRYVNFKVTVIGDVAKPGVYNIPSEQVNLLEVLGLSGDLNVTARRDNVRIIREQNGKRQFGTIDLRRADIFTSPYFQLKQNDIIYVDLGKGKAANSDQTTVRNITIATSIISTIALVITVLRNR